MRGKRILTWVLAGLMTLCLTGCTLCFFGVRNLTSLEMFERISVDDTVIGQQIARAEEQIGELAREYHFPADLITDTLTREAFVEKNREVAAWMTGLTTTGRSSEAPEWKLPELRGALELNPEFREGRGEDEISSLAMDATEEAEKLLTNTVLPIRSKLAQAGMNWVQRRVHVTSLVRFLSGVPGILLAVSALLAGLIALINLRQPIRWLRVFGSALGGAAISLLLVMLFTKLINLGGMIREASQVLAGQYDILSVNTALWVGLSALGMAALSLLMLGCYAKKNRG